MPNNVFTITISATDKATATIRKINDSMSKITRPFEEVGKSFKSLGREIGIDKIGKNLSKIGATARNAARGVGSIVAPLAGISGIATVAGIVHLADSWATLGREITYTSQNIGINTTQLQEFQGAARMAGLSGGAMAQSLQGLGNTMEDALYGRNQQALMLLNRLGIGIKRTGTGAMDVTGEFDALGHAIYNLKTPQQQWLAASQFGLTAMLPLIRKYHGDMKKAREEAEKQGIVMTPAQIKSAEDYADAMSKLSLQGAVLKNTIGNALIPALEPLVKELTSWISKNRELIGTRVTEWAKELGHWLQSIDWKGIGSDIAAFVKDVGKVVHALGGWKNVAIGLGVIMGVKLLAPIASLTLGFAKFFGLLADGIPALSGIAAGIASVGGAIAVAAAAGGIIGHEIWKHLLEGTKAGDTAGSWVAHMMAALGDKTAQDAVNRMEHPDKAAGAKYYHPERTAWFKERQAQGMQFFTSHGWTRAQAAGIMGNLAQESTLNPNAVNKNGGAMGIAQWMGKRAAQFQQVEGVPLKGASYQKQLDFVNWELHHTEGRAGSVLGQATAPDSAALVFGQMDERFGNDGSLGKRIAYANDAFAAAGPYTAGAAKDSTHKVEVAVHVTGLPPGTTAKVNTGGATTGTARVVHTTVGAVA